MSFHSRSNRPLVWKKVSRSSANFFEDVLACFDLAEELRCVAECLGEFDLGHNAAPGLELGGESADRRELVGIALRHHRGLQTKPDSRGLVDLGGGVAVVSHGL